MHGRPLLVPGLFVGTLFWFATGADAQVPAPAAPSIEISSCVVYSETNAKDRADCTAKARAKCNGKGSCAFPIGMALTDDRNIDGNTRSWKKVRVQYRCGSAEHVDGPYNQDDHATMLLSCQGMS